MPDVVSAGADVPGGEVVTVVEETRAPNAEQLAAIDAPGLVFVSAGAGTGKTTVLVERFVRAVCDRGLPIDSVLAITYTERAAGELRGRIRRRLAELSRYDLARELDGAWISTIHGFCHRLLKAHPFEAGVDPQFRVLDENQARVLASEAFEAALGAFCASDDRERIRLLATYGTRGLRRMLTGVYETLRSAGRDLVLEVAERPGLDARLEELREAARCVIDDTAGIDAAESARASAARALEVLERPPAAERLLDLSDVAARGGPRERFASYEEARRGVEQAALDELAARDRVLLEDLLRRFADAYAAAKAGESALDFEDLQLAARDLLRDHPAIRERESWRFRSVLVDEFQDTNRLQCELIDLLATEDLFFVGDEFQSIYRFRHADVDVFRERREAASRSRGAAGGAGPEGTVLASTGPESTVPSAASGGGGAGLRPAGADADRGRESGGVLALTENYRSRPEVLDVINHLFSNDFGESFQPLSASGRFADPAFGPAVELLVTDKASYKDTGTHWRAAEAKHVAARVKELVDAGEAAPGEIVLLFAAGTDARLYEQALREVGLPTFRATGRDYYHQQQVVDLLAYLRLLHNRYDDEALVTVLASPFVGVSNDALVHLRRAAERRPLYVGLERSLPAGLSERDARLFRAFKQRYDRLAGLAARLSLERLCERVLTEHDYDLAVLAQWDGRRRYANLRKLARLARSYEELRGPDVEGFVRFVREQDTVGASELEAVAEEEGTDVIRLLTIHGAKGLEFKVVVVADAGRHGAARDADEILCLPDGRLGFRVADPSTGKRRPTSDYQEVKEVEDEAAEAERRRLYYVAMTRAIDRLVVSGSIDPERTGDESTPIGWVLGRLEATELDDATDGPLEIERNGARLSLRLDRFNGEATVAVPDEPGVEDPQLALFAVENGGLVIADAPRLPDLVPVPEPPENRVRRLSYSALALFELCSYRFYAERIVGLRETKPARGNGEGGLAATEIGDAAHVLLEGLDLTSPTPPGDMGAAVRVLYPNATDDEVARIGAFVEDYCRSGIAQRIATLHGATVERAFAFEHDGVLLHGRLDVFHEADGAALVVDYKTNVLEGATPAEVVEVEYKLQRLVYALACLRAGADDVEVVYQFLEQPDELVTSTFSRQDLPALEAELSSAISAIQSGEFRPTPSEYACSTCPALDLVCAGPRLGGA